MIFITVGTHEQGLDRLLKEVDNLIENNLIADKVFAQIGYSEYIPKNYEYKKLIGFEEMDNMVKNSNIVITHGGPGSIFHAIQYNKKPIVVPRNPDFREHVDNHQILFTKRLEENKKVIGVYDIKDLNKAINTYDENVCNSENYNNNTSLFIEKFSQLMEGLM